MATGRTQGLNRCRLEVAQSEGGTGGPVSWPNVAAGVGVAREQAYVRPGRLAKDTYAPFVMGDMK
jgi:hypothetical protein